MKKFIVPVLLLMLVSCYSENEEELFPVESQQMIPVPETISFSMDVFPLIQQKCYGGSCHNSGAPGNFTSHAGVAASASSFDFWVFDETTATMPKNRGRLLNSEIEILSKWIQQGSLNN